ncbi:MAG: LPS export ABC transporter periplasmic protein LptC [Alphaproteobacteria bacterium]
MSKSMQFSAPANGATSLGMAARAPGQGNGAAQETGARSHARAARRHSIFVAIMKGLLPSLVVGLIVVYFIYAGQFSPDLPEGVAFDPGEISVSTDGIRMTNPKLSGVDEKNQPFQVNASSAVQSRENPALVMLEGIDAKLNLVDGGWVSLQSAQGSFDTDKSQLQLANNIEIKSSQGYVVKLNDAFVDAKKGSLVTNNPVLVITSSGVINANALTVLEKGKRVIFSNRVNMTITAGAAPRP